MAKKQNHTDISAAAKKLLGFPSLRAGQEEAIRSLLDGRDAVVVQPTGSGKSAIYQIAGPCEKAPQSSSHRSLRFKRTRLSSLKRKI
jgi:superfamily II DNA helicase RecQ